MQCLKRARQALSLDLMMRQTSASFIGQVPVRWQHQFGLLEARSNKRSLMLILRYLSLLGGATL